MNKKYRLSVALDIDDLLMECIPYAIRLANEKYKFNPPMTIYEKARWGKLGTRADSIYPYFSDGEFYHYDTPLTVEHETQALLAAGFRRVEVLNHWGATYTLRAVRD